MNVWDRKMTYELTESELMEYVGYLHERAEIMHREEAINSLVDQAERLWLEGRGKMPWGSAHHGRFLFHRGPTRGFYGDNDTVPPVQSYSDIRVLLPEWLPSEMVRFIADQQIREQWPENE